MNWHRALDIQMDTWKWCNSDEGTLYNASFFSSHLYKAQRGTSISMDDPILKDGYDMARHAGISLWRGDTIYVTSDMLHLILQAAHDLPNEATIDFHTLLSPYGFALFEEAIVGEDSGGETVTVSAISWEIAPLAIRAGREDAEECVVIYFWNDPYDMRDKYNPGFLEVLHSTKVPVPSLVIQHFYPALDGSTVPQFTSEPGTEIVTATVRLFVAMNLLAQQKIGTPVRLRPDRATRKRYAREHPDGPERLITLITLRRKSVKKDDEEPQKVEWSRRWVVRGHWRKQWYPSVKRHDWVYIHEFIKGPEDKPLVITERRVFNFRR